MDVSMMDQIMELIRNLGFPIAMVMYFAWRDVKFMSKLDSTLDVIQEYMKKERI